MPEQVCCTENRKIMLSVFSATNLLRHCSWRLSCFVTAPLTPPSSLSFGARVVEVVDVLEVLEEVVYSGAVAVTSLPRISCATPYTIKPKKRITNTKIIHRFML